jgi:hypothetical protein
MPPGRYELRASADANTYTDEKGARRLTVGDHDLDHLVITTRPPGILRGHLRFAGGVSPAELQPDDLHAVITGASNGGTGFRVDDHWRFALAGILEPGTLWMSDYEDLGIGRIRRHGPT